MKVPQKPPQLPELLTELTKEEPSKFVELVGSELDSQPEGAATTHKVAKEMLRQGRQPRNRGEQMIYNNYAAMQFIRSHKHLPFTPELILQLQSIMTDLTLEDPTAAGRWRR